MVASLKAANFLATISFYVYLCLFSPIMHIYLCLIGGCRAVGKHVLSTAYAELSPHSESHWVCITQNESGRSGRRRSNDVRRRLHFRKVESDLD